MSMAAMFAGVGNEIPHAAGGRWRANWLAGDLKMRSDLGTSFLGSLASPDVVVPYAIAAKFAEYRALPSEA